MTVLETSSQRSSAELTDEPRRENENTIAVQTIGYIYIQYIDDCLRAKIATVNYDDYRYHGLTRMMTMMMMTTMTATMTMQMNMTMTMTMTTMMVMMMMLMMTTIVHFDDDDGDGDGRSHVRDNDHHCICSFSEHRACTTITQVLVR